MGEDAGCQTGEVLEPHSVELHSGLLLQPMHYRVTESPFVPEIAVDRSLVHPGLVGGTTHRQGVPVAYGGTLEQPASCNDDPLPGLDGRVGGAEGFRTGEGSARTMPAS